MISNKLLRIGTAAILIASILAPQASFAAVMRAPVSNVLCTQLSTLVTDVQKRLAAEKSALETRRTERDQALAKVRANRQDTMKSKQTQAQSLRAQHINTLTGLATTDAEKKAVLDFQTSVNQAIQTRVAAVQAANDAYRRTLDNAIAARKTQEDAAVAKFTAAVQAAVAKAKSDCAAGTDSATVRTALTSALRSAHDQFMQDRLAFDKQDGTVNQAMQVRNKAASKARQDFVNVMQDARSALRSAFGLDPGSDQQPVGKPIPNDEP